MKNRNNYFEDVLKAGAEDKMQLREENKKESRD